jgi:hypothetical protein
MEAVDHHQDRTMVAIHNMPWSILHTEDHLLHMEVHLLHMEDHLLHLTEDHLHHTLAVVDHHIQACTEEDMAEATQEVQVDRQ